MSLSEVRWARGFFRLWVLLSCLWVIVSIGEAWSRFPSEHQRAYQVLSDSGEGIEPSRVAAAAAKARAANDTEAGERLQQRADEKLRQLRAAQDEELSYAISRTIVPPLMLLALGSAIAWALRGFRKN